MLLKRKSLGGLGTSNNKGKIKDDPIVYAINDIISYLCLFLILSIIWLGIAF